MIRRLPFRLRLTLWFGVLLAIILIVFGVLLYAGLRWRIYSAFDEQVQTQAELLMPLPAIDGTELTLNQSASDIDQEDYFVRLLDDTGQVLEMRGQGDPELTLLSNDVATALQGEKHFRTMSGEDDVQLRMVTLPILDENSGEIVGVLQVALDRQDLAEALRELAIALAMLIPLATVSVLGGGYLLSGRAVEPLTTMAQITSRIGEQDLKERVDLDLPNDELGRLAANFNAMMVRIEQAFARQRQFTGDAAHELRTPLALMRSQLDLSLSRPRSADDYREALTNLGMDVSRMTNLVAAMLALARLDNAGIRSGFTRTVVSEIVASAVDAYQGIARDRAVELQGEVQPAYVQGDEELLIQVLVNLIDNAMTHTPTGGRVQVRCTSEGEVVRIKVSDTGNGIAASDLPLVFERFYRPDTSRSRESGGVGLGLAICKRIVDLHGGSIGIQSKIGQGTSVEITIPSIAFESSPETNPSSGLNLHS